MRRSLYYAHQVSTIEGTEVVSKHMIKKIMVLGFNNGRFNIKF
jgi:hypothetical protein